MKTLICLATLLTFSTLSHSQIIALTETGQEVLLHADGKWEYKTPGEVITLSNSISKTLYRPQSSSFLVKSKIVDVGIYINPTKWTYLPAKDNEPYIEYNFTLKTKDVFAMFISEGTSVPLEAMADIALGNAQKAALDAKIIMQEYRMINNVKVLCIRLTGTISGLKFNYLGYYYSNETGTVQIVCGATTSNFVKRLADINDLLNGFVVVSK